MGSATPLRRAHIPPSPGSLSLFFQRALFAQKIILRQIAPIVLAVRASAARATADHARQSTVGRPGTGSDGLFINHQPSQFSARRESLPATARFVRRVMVDDPVRLGNMPEGLAFMTFLPARRLAVNTAWLQRAENAPSAQHQRGERDEAGGRPEDGRSFRPLR